MDMPSYEHNGWVQLLRMHPDLVSRLLRERCGIAVPEGTQVKVGDATLAQLTPTQVQADLIAEYRNAADVLKFSAVLEVQRDIDEDKLVTWPLYHSLVRVHGRCPACVIVLTPSQRVARWARKAIDTGPGNENFRVFVLGPDDLPPILSAEAVAADPAMAVLTMMAHGNEAGGLEVLKATLPALSGVDKQNQAVYLHLIYKAISPNLRNAFNAEVAAMDQLEMPPLPPVFQRFIDKGMAKGRAEGRAEGQASAILAILGHRKVFLTDGQRERIHSCTDSATLDEWLHRALQATCADDLFA